MTRPHQDPRAVPRRPGRPLRLGQDHVRPHALQADRGALVRLLPRPGVGRRERPGRHERRLRGAPLHRRQAAGARAADGHRRHQRAARGAQAAGRAGPAVPLPAGGDRARPARSASARSGTARGPTATSARTSSATSSRSCGGRCAVCEREGFRHVFVLERPRRSRRPTIEREPLWNDRSTSTARSTSSATSTAAATSSRRCSGSSATSRRAGR